MFSIKHARSHIFSAHFGKGSIVSDASYMSIHDYPGLYGIVWFCLQLSSLQRAVAISNMTHLSLPRASGLTNGGAGSGCDYLPSSSLPTTRTPSPAAPPPHIAVSLPPSTGGRPVNNVSTETFTLETTADLESDVEFAQLPVTVSVGRPSTQTSKG